MRTALLAVILALAGCGSINCDFVSAVKASDDVILPEYLEYVATDETLTEEDKETIRNHVKHRRALVQGQALKCK